MAAKEKSSSRLSAWLAPLLLLLAAVAVAVPASASMAGALETRAWEKTSAPLESRQLQSLQLLNLHQSKAIAGYNDALGSPLAAESGGAGDQIKTIRFSDSEQLKTAANAAQPNTRYEFGNYSWTTDANGNVQVAEGRVTLGEGGRDTALQTKIGKEGADTDIGFHLIADSFNAPTNRLNVVPGNGVRLSVDEPNLNQGAWKRFENDIRSQVKAGNDVEIKVEAIRENGNTSTRPDKFRGSYRVNGGEWKTRTYTNKR